MDAVGVAGNLFPHHPPRFIAGSCATNGSQPDETSTIMRTLLLSGLSLAALFTTASGAEPKKQPDRAKLEEMTRLQIFLDRANFGPGKIDGRGGEFTRKALERYRSAQE